MPKKKSHNRLARPKSSCKNVGYVFYGFTAMLVVLIAYLACQGLSHAALWDDEAEAAIFGRNLLTQGKVTASDGRNIYLYANGGILDKNLGSRNSPVMYYVTAVSFALFGISTWSARLPFVCLGFVTLWLLWRILRRNFLDAPMIAWYGLATLGLSVNFLLNIRQCRYYSLCFLGACLVFDQYQLCLKDKTWMRVLTLSLSVSLFFLSQYLISLVFFMSLAVMYLFECKQYGWQALGRLIVAGGLAALCCAPCVLLHEAWNRQDASAITPWLSKEKLFQIVRYVHYLNQINAMPALAFVLVLAVLWLKPTWRQTTAKLVLLTLVNAILAGGFALQPYFASGAAEVRYLLAAMPFAAASMAVALAFVHQYNRFVAVGILCALLSSNRLAWLTDAPCQWLLPAYWREIHAPYPTMQQVSAQAIRAYAKQDDLVMTIPDHESLPLIFYVGDKVHLCCMVDDQSFLKDYPFMNRLTHYPDWILLYGPDHEANSFLQIVSKPHVENGEFKQYNYRIVKRLGAYYRSTQRPELPYHLFVPNTHYNPSVEDVYLLQRQG